MKITHIAVAASLALTSTAAFAGDAKKHDLKKASDDAAKKAALDKAREEASKKTGKLVADKNDKDAAKAANDAAEKQTHARNVGAIERLQQIADATSNADLKTVVQRLSDKETKRHGLAG
jgi:hypothetical protein